MEATMDQYSGFGGCAEVTSNRRMVLPDEIWGDIVAPDTDLYWTYDESHNVPTILTNCPPHVFDGWDNNELYATKKTIFE